MSRKSSIFYKFELRKVLKHPNSIFFLSCMKISLVLYIKDSFLPSSLELNSATKKGRTLLHSAHGTPIPDNERKQNTSKGCIPSASTLSALIWRFRADDC